LGIFRWGFPLKLLVFVAVPEINGSESARRESDATDSSKMSGKFLIDIEQNAKPIN
jgi:hypothetical protein